MNRLDVLYHQRSPLMNRQWDRIQRTANILGITTDKLKLFLAGEFCEDGKCVMQTAQRAGYSVLYESGSDLVIFSDKEWK